MRQLPIKGEGGHGSVVRFPRDRVGHRHIVPFPPASSPVGMAVPEWQWPPCAWGKIIPIRATAPLHKARLEKGDGEGDVA